MAEFFFAQLRAHMSALDLLPEDNASYATQEYWESRYIQEQEDATFDWFKGFDELREPLEQVLSNRSGRILHLGCGNSRLGEDMHRAGWTDIVNVDFSPKVIETMATRCAGLDGLHWLVADVFKLDEVFDAETFDYAIDKGTLDALLTRKHDPWNPPADLCAEIERYMAQVARCLRRGGVFLHITFAQPHFRRRFVETAGLQIETRVLTGKDGGFEYFAYVCVKQ
ncbi:hypothetical protein HK105_207526 [Polyrhizophydium stewartii]|uniref:Methyltransferase domain-containing protein n=1 Tax=Polyrhizophydium stewartii TaxID=2732419 RepID=A0ABR4N0A6_9FUNG